jgi:hypothetical protein
MFLLPGFAAGFAESIFPPGGLPVACLEATGVARNKKLPAQPTSIRIQPMGINRRIVNDQFVRPFRHKFSTKFFRIVEGNFISTE